MCTIPKTLFFYLFLGALALAEGHDPNGVRDDRASDQNPLVANWREKLDAVLTPAEVRRPAPGGRETVLRPDHHIAVFVTDGPPGAEKQLDSVVEPEKKGLDRKLYSVGQYKFYLFDRFYLREKKSLEEMAKRGTLPTLGVSYGTPEGYRLISTGRVIVTMSDTMTEQGAKLFFERKGLAVVSHEAKTLRYAVVVAPSGPYANDFAAVAALSGTPEVKSAQVDQVALMAR